METQEYIQEMEKRDSIIKESKIWKGSWFILSALMNAISLINIGIDLKIVIFRWASFFQTAFELVRRIADVILSPFIIIFSAFSVEIPLPVRYVFFFSSLFMTTFFKANAEKSERFQKGVYSDASKAKTRFSFIVPLTKFIFSLFLGFCAGIIVSTITWIGYLVFGNIFVVLIVLILILLFLAVSIEIQKKDDEVAYLKRKLREYVFAVFIVFFLICLLNYFYISFIES